MIKLPFAGRHEGGRLLAAEIAARKFDLRENAIVLALPRGGVVTAVEVANHFRIPLDVVVVRKLGVPSQPELAMGAVAGDRIRVLDQELIDELGISAKEVEAVIARETEEVERREKLYRNERPTPDLHDWTVILVDDGLATGSTMLAAIEYINSFRPAALIIAVPVSSQAGYARIRNYATDFVYLAMPEPFFSVGTWYTDFGQVSDHEVTRLLEQTYHRNGPPVRTIRLAPEATPQR